MQERATVIYPTRDLGEEGRSPRVEVCVRYLRVPYIHGASAWLGVIFVPTTLLQRLRFDLGAGGPADFPAQQGFGKCNAAPMQIPMLRNGRFPYGEIVTRKQWSFVGRVDK